MGLTGQKSNLKVIAVIPARYLSTRLEGKLLLPLAGKPLILHTVERAKAASNIDRVIVATDDDRIKQAVEAAGHEAVLTSNAHQSGSDRIAEVAESFEPGTIIVNIQGDEPLISPRTIELAVEAIIETPEADMVTSCEEINDPADVLSRDIVKVVIDKNGFALYFSRAPIPFLREAVTRHGTLDKALIADPNLVAWFWKHNGLYVYRREYLLKYTKMKQTPMEKAEMLEQLRALENGAKIKVIELCDQLSSIGVDNEEDYLRVKKILER